VVCGAETIRLEIVAPVRLDIEVVDGKPPEIRKPFKVRARLYDLRGRELEVFHDDWTFSGELESANDRSAGEFGLCDTCYGMHAFRAVRPGKGSIEVRLGSLRGTLTIVP
jgi:hypothetical protein